MTAIFVVSYTVAVFAKFSRWRKPLSQQKHKNEIKPTQNKTYGSCFIIFPAIPNLIIH